MHTHVHQKTGSQTFPAALFIIAPNWKLPKCPPSVKQTGYILTMEMPQQWEWTNYTQQHGSHSQMLHWAKERNHSKRVQSVWFNAPKFGTKNGRVCNVRIRKQLLRGIGKAASRVLTIFCFWIGLFKVYIFVSLVLKIHWVLCLWFMCFSACILYFNKMFFLKNSTKHEPETNMSYTDEEKVVPCL